MAPFNSLVGHPRSGVPRVYVNRTRPGSVAGILGWILNLGRNVNFSESTDLLALGDCDQKTKEICQLAGWSEELGAVEVQIMEP